MCSSESEGALVPAGDASLRGEGEGNLNEAELT